HHNQFNDEKLTYYKIKKCRNRNDIKTQQPRKKKDRAATEEKIYESFLSLLEEKGPQAVGINAIAKKAGVSKEHIYRYFGGLQGLLLHLAKHDDFCKSMLALHDKDLATVKDLKSY